MPKMLMLMLLQFDSFGIHMGNLWHNKNYYISAVIWNLYAVLYGYAALPAPVPKQAFGFRSHSAFEYVRHEMSICFILCSTLNATNDFCTPLKIHNNCDICFGSGCVCVFVSEHSNAAIEFYGLILLYSPPAFRCVRFGKAKQTMSETKIEFMARC